MDYAHINYLMDVINPNVKGNAFKVISAVARKTWGWQGKEDAWVELSYGDLSKLTGITNVNTLKAAIVGASEYMEQRGNETQGYSYHMKTISEIDMVEPETVSEIAISESDTLSEIDIELCQNLIEPVSEIDIVQSGTKEDIKNKNNNNHGGLLPLPSKTDIASAVRVYENEIGMMTPKSSELLTAALEDFGLEMVTEAIGEAVKANVRRWNYVNGVLQNWRINGRQTRHNTNGSKGAKRNDDGSYNV